MEQVDLIEKLKQIFSRRSTPIWIWLQIITLSASVTANVILWVKKEGLEQAARYAEYNDRAWASLHNFESVVSEIDRRESTELQALFERIEYGPQADWLNRLDQMDADWLSRIPRHAHELRSKLDGYNAASKRQLEAFRYADEGVKILRSPNEKAEEFLKARIAELTKTEKFLLDVLPATPHPPPGYIGLLERQAKLKSALGEVRNRSMSETTKAALQAAWPPKTKLTYQPPTP